MNLKDLKVGESFITAKATTEGKWGFDLTSITAANWKKVCKAGNVSDKAKNVDGVWIWMGPQLKIHTGNNPITGEYGRKGMREDEKDYASYIGLYGVSEVVEQVAALIKKLADDIKDESPNESHFI